MDPLIWWMIALTAFSVAATVLGTATFVLTVWGLLASGRQKTERIYQWNHRRASVLMEKPTHITNDGRFAPVTLTPTEAKELRKRAGSTIKVVYIMEEPLYRDAQSATHVYP